MCRKVSLVVGSFPRHLNKTSCYLVHGAVAAREQVSALSAVSVVSAALLTSMVPEIPAKNANATRLEPDGGGLEFLGARHQRHRARSAPGSHDYQRLAGE